MKENFKEIYVVQIRVKLNSGQYSEWHDFRSCLTYDEATSDMKEHLEFVRGRRTPPDMRIVHRVTYDEISEIII